MRNCGLVYQNGDGVQRDFDKAGRWFEKAARAGDSIAMRSLGNFYQYGQGMRRDFVQARGWLEKAVKLAPTRPHPASA